MLVQERTLFRTAAVVGILSDRGLFNASGCHPPSDSLVKEAPGKKAPHIKTMEHRKVEGAGKRAQAREPASESASEQLSLV